MKAFFHGAVDTFSQPHSANAVASESGYERWTNHARGWKGQTRVTRRAKALLLLDEMG